MGCEVRILGGPLRGRTGRVRETWESRGQVRVDLVPATNEKAEDVYMFFQVRQVTE